MLGNARRLREAYERRKDGEKAVDPNRPFTAPQQHSSAKRRPATSNRGGAGVGNRGAGMDMHEVWEDLWTEKPKTNFRRAKRFASAEPTGAKPSMRAYLQYLHVARAPGFDASAIDLASLRATVSSPIFVARPTQTPGPGT